MPNSRRFCKHWALPAVFVALPYLVSVPRAEAFCTKNSGSETMNCIVPGQVRGPQSFSAETDENGNAYTLIVLSNAGISFPTSRDSGLAADATGMNGYSGFGGTTNGLTLTNNGTVSLSQGSGNYIQNAIFGLRGVQTGGDGGSTDDPTTITNTNTVSVNLPFTLTNGGAVIYGASIGGVAGPATGASGANSVGTEITNSGAVSADLSSQSGFAGIAALASGGNAINGSANGSGGFETGLTSVTNSGPVSVNLNWEDPNSNSGLYGILAQATGGNGASNTDASGGAGGTGGQAMVTLLAGGSVTVDASGPTHSGSPLTPDAGVVASSIGGIGGAGSGYNSYSGAPGGSSSNADVSITDANVSTSTSDGSLPGVLTYLVGAAGGTGGDPQQNPSENGGAGGSASNTTISVTSQTVPVAISTTNQTGSNSPAVAAYLVGGTGGGGGNSMDSGASTSHGGDGGTGGDGGGVIINLTGSPQGLVTLATNGASSPGIYAGSTAGAGGLAGTAQTGLTGSADGGNGGDGGDGADVTVNLASSAIATQGATSPGIVVMTAGGVGGNAGSANATTAYGGNGGTGGEGGVIDISLDGASSISTQQSQSAGILAQSLSAAGGNNGGDNQDFGGRSGNPGFAGQAGTITITNAGAILTAGDASPGIDAQSMAGTGGSSEGGWSLFHSGGGPGAPGGEAGVIAITNTGSIFTAGQDAEGVIAQSVGGGGGGGGQASGVFYNVGGNGGNGSNGGAVNFTANGGTIMTSGLSGAGVLEQSLGGGGGDGGDGGGLTVTVGGNGGTATSGGQVTAALNQGSAIITSGDQAPGIILQSVGGGGGNAGNSSAGGLFASVSLGGTGGAGGDGGTSSVTTDDANITTTGDKSPGLIVQSIGGGGGTGGESFAGGVAPGFSSATSIGGTGGIGGIGGTASATVVGGLIATGQNPLFQDIGAVASGLCTSLPCNTLPVDAFGVVVQSIGGGGGDGGSAIAKALAVSPDTTSGGAIALSATFAQSGNGGDGNVGGAAQFSLSSGGQITTNGQGSDAVVAQSIGGGGGNGGDSSALAAVAGYGKVNPGEGSPLTFEASFSLGAAGGTGSDGGTVGIALGGTASACTASGCTFAEDPLGSAPTSIVTYGDFADGVLAQSIGGGGGNAGFGSANTKAFGTGTTASLKITQGATGGGGGDGGDVIINLYPGNGITTYGSGADGVIAQSIGGGGGTSQGGSFDLGASFSAGGVSFSPGLALTQGATGGTASDGGSVSVNLAAPIITYGGGADGVVAQSIGGGGGMGGSSGADASQDNPVLVDTGQRASAGSSTNTLLMDSPFPLTTTFALSIGGTGGDGGTGGPVNLGLYSSVATLGDWANGIVAQSIGGGGGMGGSAAATGTGGLTKGTVNLEVAVGGQGGIGGDGGPLTVTLNDNNNLTINTKGFGAAGILAQSIGGGGGVGADGSDSATGDLAVGAGQGGKGGAGGDGGAVTLTSGNDPGTTVDTAGPAADGVDLQSIGGGGGVAGGGSSLFGAAFEQGGALNLSAGGTSGANGNGGAITMTSSNNLGISTLGNDAFGILAQSIGGGGGSVISNPSSTSVPNVILGDGGTGDGGSVTVTESDTITTVGIGAHGIVAQSIGGGGGVIRLVDLPSDTPTLTTDQTNMSGQSGKGNGGSVTITNNGSISTSGPGAFGIVAQSVGGGGGLLADGNTIFAGSPHSGGTGGAVSVTTNGPISATGASGIGIFAQSTGSSSSGLVNVVLNSNVTGGTGVATPTTPGASGVQIDSPSGSNGNHGNTILVNANTTLQSAAGEMGTAIIQTGGGFTTLTNNGQVIGSTYLSSGAFINNGTYVAGPEVQGSLTNNGLVNLGLPGSDAPVKTLVTGNFTQTAGGRLAVIVDSVNNRASQINVGIAANVGGTILPSAVTLLPGAIPIVTASSLTETATSPSSLLFDWHVAPSGQTLTLSPSSDFTPAGVPLTDSEASLAGYLTKAWNNGDTAFATRFADLSKLNDAGQYLAMLDAESGKATEAQSVAFINSAGSILGAALQCPVAADETAQSGKDNCIWSKVSGQQSNQWETGDTQGYQIATASYRIGGQHEVAPDWSIGGSFAFGETWGTSSSAGGDGSKGYGETYDGSVSLKHTMGPWFVAGSLGIGTGAYTSERVINLPGANVSLDSNPRALVAGSRVRGGYEFTFYDLYVRPYGDLDVIYTNLPGFTESGPDLYALHVQGSSRIGVALSPMVEVGGLVNLDAKTTLKSFVAVGISIIPDNRRSMSASFVGASPEDGTFRSYLNSPDLLGNVQLGTRLYRAGGFEVKFEYDASVGGSFLSQGASAQLAYHF
jgi:hypothetical protein